MSNESSRNHELTRRQVMRRLGALGLAAGGSIPLGVAQAKAAPVGTSAVSARIGDEYDELRERWIDLTTGRRYDQSDPDFLSSVNDVESLALGHRALLDDTPGRTRVFVDRGLVTDADMSANYKRLYEMALAYVIPGTSVYGDDGFAEEICDGLRIVHDVLYNADQAEFGNWYYWRIGGPLRMLDTCAFLFDKLDANDLANYLAAFDHFVPAVALTASNRMYLCRLVGVRGILGRNTSKLENARDGMSNIFVYVSSGDGYYRDGSFLQHLSVPYIGSYGTELLGNIAPVLALLANSTWKVTDPNQSVILDAVDRTYAPVIFNAKMMDFVGGRHVNSAGNHSYSHAVMENMLVMASSVDAARAARWRGMVRGWVDRDTYDDITSPTSLPRKTLFKGLLADNSVIAVDEPINHRIFPKMDRLVHRRPGWAFGVAMSSERISAYEHDYPMVGTPPDPDNYHNPRAFHQGAGATYLYNSYAASHDKDYWATVDPYRLAGITVDSQPLDPGAGGCCPNDGTHRAAVTNSFAGGAALGDLYGVAGHDLRVVESSLTGRKSWFFLDEYIVFLGAGITGGSGFPVETVVENRKLSGSATTSFIVDNVAQPSAMPWTKSFPDVQWAHLDGVAGYVFLDSPASLSAVREPRTGGSYNRPYLTVWIDHGPSPSSKTYAYLLVPNATADRTAALAAAPGIDIVTNTASAQAVSAPTERIFAANFFTAGEVSSLEPGLSADGPCSIIGQWTRSGLDIAISDPTHRRDTMTVVIDDLAPGTVEADQSVTVTWSNRTVTLRADSSAHDGRSHRVGIGFGRRSSR